MSDLISKNKLIKDLRGIHDVLTGQGDPFLASVLRVAIECVEKQEPVFYPDAEATGDDPKKEKRLIKAIKRLEQGYAAAKDSRIIRDPVAYALYQAWKAADEGRL